MSLPLVHRCVLPVALAWLWALGGCARMAGGPKAGSYLVSVAQAEFYKFGPAQSFGADFVLKKGERLTMLDRQWGFSRVLTDTGVVGYISNEQIAQILQNFPVEAAVNNLVELANLQGGEDNVSVVIFEVK